MPSGQIGRCVNFNQEYNSGAAPDEQAALCRGDPADKAHTVDPCAAGFWRMSVARSRLDKIAPPEQLGRGRNGLRAPSTRARDATTHARRTRPRPK